jgi:glycosyltransferase involved in cell wall biosynthesis
MLLNHRLEAGDPMKVVLDGQITGADGIGRLTRQLSDAIDRIGAEEGLSIHVEPADGTPRYSLAEGGRLLDAVRAQRADLLHLLDYRVPLTPTPVPVVANIHDVLRLRHPEFCYSDEEFTARFGTAGMTMLQEATIALRARAAWPTGATRYPVSWHEEFYGRMVAHTATVASVLITPSNTVAFQLDEALGRGARATVASYGVDHLPAGRPSRLKPGSYVLYVGQARLHKGLPNVVEAFYLSAASRRGLRLALVGRDFTAGDTALGPHVDVIGEVDDADLAGLYQGAAALVHLASHEGFGFTPLEALSCGTQVLAADLPVLRETLGEHARFTDPTDPRATARELDMLLESGDTPTARQTRVEWAARYTWEDCARRVIACYRDALR